MSTKVRFLCHHQVRLWFCKEIDKSELDQGACLTLACGLAILTHAGQLGLEQVDMYLIHNPTLVINLESTWKDFELIKERGQAKYVLTFDFIFRELISSVFQLRSIGVSNFDVKTLQKLLKVATVKPAVNQVFTPLRF